MARIEEDTPYTISASLFTSNTEFDEESYICNREPVVEFSTTNNCPADHDTMSSVESGSSITDTSSPILPVTRNMG